MKKMIKASNQQFAVNICFAGMLGCEEVYHIDDTSNEQEAITLAIELAKEDLEVIDVEEVDEGEYVVTVSFNGFIGCENQYDVYAENEEEATELALEESENDLEGEIVDSDEEDEY